VLSLYREIELSGDENDKVLDMAPSRMRGNFDISASNDFRQSPEERKGVFGAEPKS
jgi:hypothetical protein